MPHVGAHDPIIVLLELVGDSVGLVKLAGVGHDGRCTLVELPRHGLVLSNDSLPGLLVERVEEGEEAGRDALLVCSGMSAAAHGRKDKARLTIEVNRALNDVVAHHVAVGEVLGDNRGLGGVVRSYPAE